MGKRNDSKQERSNPTLRKDFIRCWVHNQPGTDRSEASALYDRLEKTFPEMTRGGHRGMVGRVKPWETVVHECPRCGFRTKGAEGIERDFGLRRQNGKVYFQSHCPSCRSKAAKGDKGGNGNVRINPQVEEFFTNGPESCM